MCPTKIFTSWGSLGVRKMQLHKNPNLSKIWKFHGMKSVYLGSPHQHMSKKTHFGASKSSQGSKMGHLGGCIFCIFYIFFAFFALLFLTPQVASPPVSRARGGASEFVHFLALALHGTACNQGSATTPPQNDFHPLLGSYLGGTIPKNELDSNPMEAVFPKSTRQIK